MKVGLAPLSLSFFFNMRRSPRKRASIARVSEKSITIRFFVAIASLKAGMTLSTCRAVAGPDRLTVMDSSPRTCLMTKSCP